MRSVATSAATAGTNVIPLTLLRYGSSVVSIDSTTEIPYIEWVQTVVETPAYLSAAEDAGLAEADRETIVTMIALDPIIGDQIQGTGGCRKVRFAGRAAVIG